ncbi:hypothetical protein QQF64_022211 [Cirrhinus molitorella]|uniref:L1 transposable element RRM domain-containing protein n=1 Tax=Cirrhinus molitorella TaxID=172907 RepID=A0ABR3L7U2_9TELE
MQKNREEMKEDLRVLRQEIFPELAALHKAQADSVTEYTEMGKSLSDTMDRVAILKQSHERMAKDHKKMQEKCMDLENRSRRQNLRFVGAEAGNPVRFIKDLLLELFGTDGFGDSSMTVDRAHRTLAPKPKLGERPRPLIVRFHYFSDKEKILKLSRNKGRLYYKGTPVHIFPENKLTIMDPASAAELRDFLTNSNTRMDRQEEQSLATARAVQALVAQVSELTSQLQQLRMEGAPAQPPSTPSPPVLADLTSRNAEPRLPPPAFYSARLCSSFLSCQLGVQHLLGVSLSSRIVSCFGCFGLFDCMGLHPASDSNFLSISAGVLLLRAAGINYSLFYPAKLTVTVDGIRYTFEHPREAEKFLEKKSQT